MWSKEYMELINRNIGLLTQGQQETLRKSCVAVFGLGGTGGVMAEIFSRSGIGGLKIVDKDKFEPTNLNRQIFSFRDTLGRLKTDVSEEFLKRINPEIRIEKFTQVNAENIGQILQSVNIAVLAIDSLEPCIVISRACRKLGIPLVEGWAIPFGNVRVFTKDTPSLEEVYHLPTLSKEINSISAQDFTQLKLHMLETLKRIDGIEDFYPPLAIERILKGEIPSFAPLVWLTAVLMSLEGIKILLKWGEVSLSPNFSLYNPFIHKIPEQE